MSIKGASARSPQLGYSDSGTAFAEFEQTLVSNSGEDAFEVAIYLLAAKIFDEISREEGVESRFRVHDSESRTLQEVEKRPCLDLEQALQPIRFASLSRPRQREDSRFDLCTIVNSERDFFNSQS